VSFNNVKLIDRDVYQILFLNKVKGLQPYQLEKIFPVSSTTIKNIVNGKSRKDCYYAFLDYMEKHTREEVLKIFEAI